MLRSLYHKGEQSEQKTEFFLQMAEQPALNGNRSSDINRKQVIAERLAAVERRNKGKDYDITGMVSTLYLIAIAAKLLHTGQKEPNSLEESVIEQDILLFKDIFLPGDIRYETLQELYIAALQDPLDTVYYAKRLFLLLPPHIPLFEEAIKNLFIFLEASGKLSSENYDCLKQIGSNVGLNEAFVKGVVYHYMVPQDKDPYHCLRVNHSVTYLELKKAYRDAIKDCHPDSVIARKISGELASIFQAQYQACSESYEMIKKQKKFK